LEEDRQEFIRVIREIRGQDSSQKSNIRGDCGAKIATRHAATKDSFWEVDHRDTETRSKGRITSRLLKGVMPLQFVKKGTSLFSVLQSPRMLLF